MKKLLLAGAFAVFGWANAQTQQGNWMVGGQVANMQFTNGVNINLTPQVGYFVKDNWAVGGQVGLNIYSPQGSGAGTQTNWTLGAFTRYYLGANEGNTLLKNGKFFGEGSIGFGGSNSSVGSSTNGIDLGIGAGYAYFITNNVSLDALLKFDGKVGGGSSFGKGDLGLRIGFQIYLPTARVKSALRDEQ